MERAGEGVQGCRGVCVCVGGAGMQRGVCVCGVQGCRGVYVWGGAGVQRSVCFRGGGRGGAGVREPQVLVGSAPGGSHHALCPWRQPSCPVPLEAAIVPCASGGSHHALCPWRQPSCPVPLEAATMPYAPSTVIQTLPWHCLPLVPLQASIMPWHCLPLVPLTPLHSSLCPCHPARPCGPMLPFTLCSLSMPWLRLRLTHPWSCLAHTPVVLPGSCDREGGGRGRGG